jgi:O-antigen/teichoic acid export membrane protein
MTENATNHRADLIITAQGAAPESSKGSDSDHRVRGPARLVQKVGPWVKRGGLTLFDHGFISGSNFVISILLARWLSPGEYGAYAVAFAALILLMVLYQSLLLEPMAIFGASAYRECLRGYLKSLLVLNLATALVIFFSLAITAEVVLRLGQRGGLPGALLAVGLGGPCYLLLSLARRTFYLELSPGPAVGGAAVYCVLTLGGLYGAYRYHWISPMSALLLMGFGALTAAILLLMLQKSRLPRGRGAPGLRETWRRHWNYGQWALAGAAVLWVPCNIFYPLLASFSGMRQAGELKALMNFAAPPLQTYAGLSALLLPYAASSLEKGGWSIAPFLTRRFTVVCFSCALVYWSLVLLLEGPAFRLLYSGRYAEVAYLLPVIALFSLAGSIFIGPSTVLRAMECPDSVFFAVCISSGIAFAVGLPATKAFGIRGAVWAMALSEVLAFMAAGALLRRKVRGAAAVASSTF